MRKVFTMILTSIFALAFLLFGVACFEETTYELRVDDPSGILIQDYKTSYAAGETVTVRRGIVHDADVALTLDNELLENGEEVFSEELHYYQYTFTMPNHDVVLTVNVQTAETPPSPPVPPQPPEEPDYRLTIIDEGGQVIESVKEYYKAEEKVAVKIALRDPYLYPLFYLNGEYCKGASVYWTYEMNAGIEREYFVLNFDMPACDTTLTIINRTIFTVEYDYGVREEGKVTPLLGGSKIFFDAEKYEMSSFLAGDLVAIYHTGELYTKMTNRDEVIVKDGEIIEIIKRDANIIKLKYTDAGWFSSNGDREIALESPEYVVSSDGSFKAVSELLSGTVIYATENERWLDENNLLHYSVSALYDHYPLPTHDAEEFYPWITNLKKENIRKVEIKEEGCVPSLILDSALTSTAQTDIDKIYTYLKDLMMLEIPNVEGSGEYGGSTKFLTVYTDTDVYTLSLDSGYDTIDGVEYRASSNIPTLEQGEREYCFITASNNGVLYIQGQKKGMYQVFDEIIFTETQDVVDANHVEYRLVALDTLGEPNFEIILHDEKHFSYEGKTYKIVGEVDFSKVFEDYPLNEV